MFTLKKNVKKSVKQNKRENKNKKNKFQQKICFINFLFFYFISTLHQAFTFSLHFLISTLWQHKGQKSFRSHNLKITSTLNTELSSLSMDNPPIVFTVSSKNNKVSTKTLFLLGLNSHLLILTLCYVSKWNSIKVCSW